MCVYLDLFNNIFCIMSFDMTSHA